VNFAGSLTIPDSVTRIDSYAFNNCSKITTINVSDWTDIPEIAHSAFGGLSLDGGTVIAPSGLGITISTFDGLPDTWQLVEV
jgi:hypothetical protein